MKKAICLMVVAFLVVSLSACGAGQKATTIPEDQYEALNIKYLSSTLVAMIIANPWSDANEIEPSYFMYYFASSMYQSGSDFTWGDDGFALIPDGELEPFVQSRFNVSTKHLRSGEYYDAEKNGYKFGGLGSTAYTVVTGAEQRDKLLTISYDIIGPMDCRVAYGVLEIELDGVEYKYLSNRHERDAPSFLMFPTAIDGTVKDGVIMMDSSRGTATIQMDDGERAYDGRDLANIIAFYEKEALPALEAQGTADTTKHEDGWYWSGTYRGGRPLTIEIQSRFGAGSYIIAATYTENAGAPDWNKYNSIDLEQPDSLYADYFGYPYYAGLFDSTWEVPYNLSDKGALPHSSDAGVPT